jgi:hypothetical protein
MAPPDPEPLIEMPELASGALLTLRRSGPAVCLMLLALSPLLYSMFRFPYYEDMSLTRHKTLGISSGIRRK